MAIFSHTLLDILLYGYSRDPYAINELFKIAKSLSTFKIMREKKKTMLPKYLVVDSILSNLAEKIATAEKMAELVPLFYSIFFYLKKI